MKKSFITSGPWNTFGPAHKILELITFFQMPLLNGLEAYILGHLPLLPHQGFSYLSEVRARDLLNLGKKHFLIFNIGKI